MRLTRAERMSMVATAFASCSVTRAVRRSSERAMYSGSRSCATVAPGPLRRMPAGSSRWRGAPALNAAKPTVRTAGPRREVRPFVEMIETDPSGSAVPGVA